MRIFAKRVWSVVFVITFLLAIFFGIRTYQQHRHSDYIAVQTYNVWRNQMQGIQNYLYSQGPGEKPHPHGSMSENPNMALMNAESASQIGGATASEASQALSGRLSTDLSYLAGVNMTLQEELSYTIDHGTYVKGVYEFTEPSRISIADRNYLYHQLTHVVLAGMPETETNVSQIFALENHLKALNGNSPSFGVSSDSSFTTFMTSTGQFK